MKYLDIYWRTWFIAAKNKTKIEQCFTTATIHFHRQRDRYGKGKMKLKMMLLNIERICPLIHVEFYLVLSENEKEKGKSNWCGGKRSNSTGKKNTEHFLHL